MLKKRANCFGHAVIEKKPLPGVKMREDGALTLQLNYEKIDIIQFK